PVNAISRRQLHKSPPSKQASLCSFRYLAFENLYLFGVSMLRPALVAQKPMELRCCRAWRQWVGVQAWQCALPPCRAETSVGKMIVPTHWLPLRQERYG